jgi:anti-sigma B factor antagonist
MVDFAPWLHVEDLDGTALIAFTRTDMSDDAALVVGGQLSELADRAGCRRFVLNLAAAHCLSSAMLGKLITFHKKVKQRGGELTLCSLGPELASRFESMRLDRLFHICSSEEEALGEVPAGVS